MKIAASPQIQLCLPLDVSYGCYFKAHYLSQQWNQRVSIGHAIFFIFLTLSSAMQRRAYSIIPPPGELKQMHSACVAPKMGLGAAKRYSVMRMDGEGIDQKKK